MYSQKEAVYTAISSVKKFIDGSRVTLSKDELTTVAETIAGFVATGDMVIKSGGHNSPSEVRKYCRSLVKNWLGKDSRLNGGVSSADRKASAPKRDPNEDEGVTAMKKLKKLAQDNNVELSQDLDEAIEEKLSEAEVKRKAVLTGVNVSALPEDFMDFLEEEIG